MDNFLEILTLFFNYGILFYSISLFSSYIILTFLSAKDITKYSKQNAFSDHHVILSSPLAPPISLIAPAYNEAETIVENIRSMLSLHYGIFEIIVVNDGSKDNTLQKLLKTFELERVPFALGQRLKTKPVKGIYKSRNASYGKLIVADKENGGKADALNVGLNISRYPLFACVDVDSVIEQGALLRMVKPFLEEDRKQVIGTGGVVGIANSCRIEYGRLISVELPRSFLPRVQVLEYIRAFLLVRMAWSRLNGLLIISGAFGMFDKEIAIEAGGYNPNIVGEDIELVVRMRRFMQEHKRPYKVVYIPDPLCWTEAPSSIPVLSRQRNRWARGTAETIWLHKKLFFNPKFGAMGLLSYPYWFFFEWMAPLMEIFGVLFFIAMGVLGRANWLYFFSLLGAVYAFAVMFSVFALLFEELSYNRYKKKIDIFRMIATSILEPIFFHPINVWGALRGNYNLLAGIKNWGEMTRAGFRISKKK